MSRRAQENLVVAIMLLLFAGMLVMSFDYGPRARMVPVPIAIIGILLCGAQLVWQNLRPADELHVDVLELVAGRAGSERRKTAADRAASSAAPPVRLRGELAAGGIVAVLLALFLVLGPVPAIFLFSTGYFVLSGQSSWFRGLVYGFLCAALLYLVFGYTLGIQLNRGAIAPLIGDYLHF